MANSEYKAGELFVDFKGRGLQTMVHGLQLAKTSFNAVKGAANSAMREVVGFLDENNRTTLKLQKTASLTGLPFGDLKKLDAWSRRIGVDMSMVSSSIIKTQQDLFSFARGEGGNADVWNQLGINPKEFNVNDPLEVFERLAEGFNRQNAASKTWIATQLGFSGEMVYALEHYDTLVNKNLLLTQDEIRKQEELNDKWLETKFTVDQATEKVKTGILYNVIPLLEKFNGWLTNIVTNLKNVGKVGEEIGNKIGLALRKGAIEGSKWLWNSLTWGDVYSDERVIAARMETARHLPFTKGRKKAKEKEKEIIDKVAKEKHAVMFGVMEGLRGEETQTTQKSVYVSPTEQVRATGQSMRPQNFESMRGGYKRDETGRIIQGIPDALPTNPNNGGFPPVNAPSVTPTVGNGGIMEVNINLSQNVGSGDPMAIKDATLMALSTARDEINNYYERSISIV